MEPSDKISNFQIFQSIWLKPRKTFQKLIENNYQDWVFLLIILGGISNIMENATSKESGDHFPLWGILLISIIGGIFFGWMGYYLLSVVLSKTGSWMGGKASSDKLLLVIAYAQIPIILNILIYITLFSLFSTTSFSYEEIQRLNTVDHMILIPLLLLGLVLSIWTFILTIIGISEAQNFTILEAIGNLVLSFLVLIVPILIVFGLFKSIAF